MGRLDKNAPNDPLMRPVSGGTGLQPVAPRSPQLSFANLREQQRPPSVPTAKFRAHEHARARGRGASLGDARSEGDLATLRRLEALHAEFLAGLPEGSVCFAQDFTEWLRRRGDLPPEGPVAAGGAGGFDMRRTSSFWIKARADGLVGFDGYAPNGGGERASSTVRTRYRVLRGGTGLEPVSPGGTGFQPVSPGGADFQPARKEASA